MIQFLTTDIVAKRLYTTPYTVRKYIRQNKLKAIKLGKHYLVEEEQLTEFLNDLIYKN